MRKANKKIIFWQRMLVKLKALEGQDKTEKKKRGRPNSRSAAVAEEAADFSPGEPEATMVISCEGFSRATEVRGLSLARLTFKAA